MEKLEYNSSLTVQEAEDKFNEVKGLYDRISSKYSGIKRLFRRNLSDKDKKGLEESVLVLFPLNSAEVVQKRESRIVDSYKVVKLSMDIMSFMSKFRNSGLCSYKS